MFLIVLLHNIVLFVFYALLFKFCLILYIVLIELLFVLFNHNSQDTTKSMHTFCVLLQKSRTSHLRVNVAPNI